MNRKLLSKCPEILAEETSTTTCCMQPVKRLPHSANWKKSTSPFYKLVEGGVAIELVFPCDANGDGPWLLPDGTPDPSKHSETNCEKVEVIDLGSGWYRLAMVTTPVAGFLQMQWGDVIQAEAVGEKLNFMAMRLPAEFLHYESTGFGGFSPTESEIELVDRMHGGWVTELGRSVFTIPVDRAAEFEGEAEARGISVNRLWFMYPKRVNGGKKKVGN